MMVCLIQPVFRIYVYACLIHTHIHMYIRVPDFHNIAGRITNHDAARSSDVQIGTVQCDWCTSRQWAFGGSHCWVIQPRRLCVCVCVWPF